MGYDFGNFWSRKGCGFSTPVLTWVCFFRRSYYYHNEKDRSAHEILKRTPKRSMYQDLFCWHGLKLFSSLRGTNSKTAQSLSPAGLEINKILKSYLSIKW